MKKIFAFMVAALFLLSSFGFAYAEKGASREAVGMSIMGFNTQDLDGNTVTSDILNNAVCTVINEWATWCGPCVSEMPHFQSVHEHYSATPEADVQIIGAVYVSGSCTPASAKQFLESNGYTWLNLLEDDIIENAFFTTDSIPSTLIVDRNGLVRDHVVGSFSSAAQLEDFIDGWYQTLLEEEPPVTPGPSEPPAPVGLLGDADGDGEVTVADAVIIARMSLGLVEAGPLEIVDVDGDGALRIADSLTLLRMILGLIQD